MNIDRALQLNTAALAVMGSVFLGLGHVSLVLPLALAVGAVASATLTSVFRWLRLNRMIANLVALAAVAWSLRNFLSIGSSDQLLAIADMLVYLQIVLLFQDKTGRVYWQLIVLSLLQVVVAAALYIGPQFAILLAVYMGLALSALVLLCLHRESRRGAAPAEASRPTAPTWRMLLECPRMCAPLEGERLIPGAGPLVRRQVALLGLATLLFAGVFFYAAPRLGESGWSGNRGSGSALTGFAAEAHLEESGRIHQSNQLVMRVALSDPARREPYLMISDPYFNGVALTDYVRDARGSHWSPPPRTPRLARPFRAREGNLVPGPTSSNLVRQDYQLEPGASGLFFIVPMHRLTQTPDVLEFSSRLNRLTWRQAGEQHGGVGEIRYAVATTSLRNGRQLHAIPHTNPLQTPEDRFLLNTQRQTLLQFDEQQFPAIAALAAQVIREEELESAGPLAQAQALERHFLAPDRYRYSLLLDFHRDRGLDPIEDFVANHRTGHCEYFASALVLMLRSRGIPARLIVGYRGGDFNSLGAYYQVRQRHSHAWVEALVPAGQAPAWELAGSPSDGGAWYRLDPTPSSTTLVAVDDGDGVFDRIGEAFDYVDLLWRDYVLSLNASKQQDTIYEPVSERALGSLPAWMEARGMRRLARRLAAQFGWNLDLPRRDATSRVLDWRTGTFVIALAMAAIIVVQALFFLSQLIASWRAGQRQVKPAAKGRLPRFYRRLRSLLGRLHLPASAGQTPRELANAAAERIQRQLPRSAAAALPAQIVAAYYRVRFGGATLDSQEQAAIEQALDELTPAVHAAGQARP